ncbi:MAG: branched-chain amino acid ABC transporter permease [Lachnospiraceae bacterium]|nr:branched-chain amino acid ABC transporter permease [Lachnospiraceae bacterium]
MSFLNYLINGLSLGSVYAIIALGYTMVYGIAKMLNFAHGDIIMIGSYIVYTCMSMAGLHPAVSVLCAVAGCLLLGVVTERVAYRPLRGASSSLAVLITAIGVSYLLQNIALLTFGAEPKAFTTLIGWKGISLFDGALMIRGTTIVTIGASLLILVGLELFINYTKNGQAMLAVAQDKGAATLMGIDVNKTIALTFAIGSSLAAVAGVLLCSAYPTITPYIGAMPGIKAFVAAVFGGIGSIPGAMIGGLVLGIVEILSRTYISSQLADAIVFGILIVVLLVKPTGLLGKRVMEKV